MGKGGKEDDDDEDDPFGNLSGLEEMLKSDEEGTGKKSKKTSKKTPKGKGAGVKKKPSKRDAEVGEVGFFFLLPSSLPGPISASIPAHDRG